MKFGSRARRCRRKHPVSKRHDQRRLPPRPGHAHDGAGNVEFFLRRNHVCQYELHQNGSDTFTNFTNGGQITNNGPLVWDGGENNLGGNLIVNSNVSTDDFTNAGVITINSGGVLNNHLSDLTSGGGGQITVNSGGTLNADSQSEGVALDLQDSLLVNNGTVTGTTNVYYGATVKGSGTFGPINVLDGGTLAMTATANLACPAWRFPAAALAANGLSAVTATIEDATIDIPYRGRYAHDVRNLAGAGPLTKSGVGLLILSGSNSYLDGTVVDAGTLEFTSAASLPDGSNLTVGAGGTFIFDPSVSGASLDAASPHAASALRSYPSPAGHLGTAYRSGNPCGGGLNNPRSSRLSPALLGQCGGKTALFRSSNDRLRRPPVCGARPKLTGRTMPGYATRSKLRRCACTAAGCARGKTCIARTAMPHHQ